LIEPPNESISASTYSLDLVLVPLKFNLEMKFDTPEDSNVSNLEPAFTATVNEANGELYYSDTTLKPLSNLVKALGLSYLRASGISPAGNSPKSTNADFENCNYKFLSTFVY
jgi:hypothetical protein